MPDATDPAASALDGIRAIEQAATPGPWRLERDSCDCGDGYGCSHGSWPHAIHTSRAHIERPDGKRRDYDFGHTEISELGDADAEFIIAARTAVPRLLKAVETALTGAGTLDAESARFGKIAEDADPGSAVEVAALAASQAYDRSARILREAITAELTENDSAPAGAVREDGGP